MGYMGKVARYGFQLGLDRVLVEIISDAHGSITEVRVKDRLALAKTWSRPWELISQDVEVSVDSSQGQG